MSLFADVSGGSYDDSGMWHRTKFCMIACKDCNCMPPDGVIRLTGVQLEKHKEMKLAMRSAVGRVVQE